jgi:hypothetical protein
MSSKQGFQVSQSIGLRYGFVFSPPCNAWKTEGNSTFVPRACLYSFKGDFKN